MMFTMLDVIVQVFVTGGFNVDRRVLSSEEILERDISNPSVLSWQSSVNSGIIL